MNKTSGLLAGALLVSLAAADLALRAEDEMRVASLPPAATGAAAYVPGEVVVQFRTDVEDRDAARTIRMAGGRQARRSRFGQRYRVALDDGFTIAETLSRLRLLPEVEFAEPNLVARAFQGSRAGHFSPNDRLYRFQWHLQMVNAERTWGIQKGDSSVVVAVLDTGVAYEDFGPFRRAPDFEGTVFVGPFNAVTGSTHANDDNFHGTHVASVIAEATNNNEGAAGLAFATGLMPIKVLNAEGTGTFFDIAEGVDHARAFTQNGANPVKVINLSLGAETCGATAQVMRAAVDRAVAAGITVVAAAGNSGATCVSFPASMPNVIAVGAVDGRKVKAPYSQSGPELDLVAPGGDLDRDDTGADGRPDSRPDGVLQQSFDPGTAERFGRYDDFAYFFVSGTSQATPHVAALAALLYRQGITEPASVQKAMETTAEDLGSSGRDDTFGHGLIRPSEALKGLGLNH